MPAGGEQAFIPDRRGNRLERYSFAEDASRRSHRLYLRATPEIAAQFQNVVLQGPSYRLAGDHVRRPGVWTHCLEAPGPPDAGARDLAELLSEVLTLPRLPSVAFTIAMDWYKIPADGVDPDNWRNTPDGERVSAGKYWTRSPKAMAEAGRMLARRLLNVIRRHPILASADVAVAVPGHDRTYLSFGEQLGASVASALGQPLIKVATRAEFRPPAKALPRTGSDVMRGEFSVAEDLTGMTALVVDDVFMTGRTMAAVSSATLRAGAARACGLVAVRTMKLGASDG